MANGTQDNTSLYFIVGALVVGLIGLGFFYYNGMPRTNTPSDINIINQEDRTPDLNIDINPQE